MSNVGKPIRPGMFCSQEKTTGVDVFGVDVVCVLNAGETRPRWRRPAGKAGRQARARTGTGTRRARTSGGRRAPSSATYTGLAEYTTPTLPYMPVVRLTQLPAPAVPAADPVYAPGDEPLTADERIILDFESRGWTVRGLKENAIFEELQMSAIKYYQQLNRLLNRRVTMREYPGLVSRLDRLRTGSRRW